MSQQSQATQAREPRAPAAQRGKRRGSASRHHFTNKRRRLTRAQKQTVDAPSQPAQGEQTVAGSGVLSRTRRNIDTRSKEVAAYKSMLQAFFAQNGDCVLTEAQDTVLSQLRPHLKVSPSYHKTLFTQVSNRLQPQNGKRGKDDTEPLEASTSQTQTQTQTPTPTQSPTPMNTGTTKTTPQPPDAKPTHQTTQFSSPPPKSQQQTLWDLPQPVAWLTPQPRLHTTPTNRANSTTKPQLWKLQIPRVCVDLIRSKNSLALAERVFKTEKARILAQLQKVDNESDSDNDDAFVYPAIK